MWVWSGRRDEGCDEEGNEDDEDDDEAVHCIGMWPFNGVEAKKFSITV